MYYGSGCISMLQQFCKLSSKSYSFLTSVLDKIHLWRDLGHFILMCTVILKQAEHTLVHNVFLLVWGLVFSLHPFFHPLLAMLWFAEMFCVEKAGKGSCLKAGITEDLFTCGAFGFFLLCPLVIFSPIFWYLST